MPDYLHSWNSNRDGDDDRTAGSDNSYCYLSGYRCGAPALNTSHALCH